eukprot:6743531-Prymnesium_polylepis.1
MDIHGYPPILYPWISRIGRISMWIHGYPWICTHSLSMDIHGYPWISMDITGYPGGQSVRTAPERSVNMSQHLRDLSVKTSV